MILGLCRVVCFAWASWNGLDGVMSTFSQRFECLLSCHQKYETSLLVERSRMVSLLWTLQFASTYISCSLSISLPSTDQIEHSFGFPFLQESPLDVLRNDLSKRLLSVHLGYSVGFLSRNLEIILDQAMSRAREPKRLRVRNVETNWSLTLNELCFCCRFSVILINKPSRESS